MEVLCCPYGAMNEIGVHYYNHSIVQGYEHLRGVSGSERVQWWQHLITWWRQLRQGFFRSGDIKNKSHLLLLYRNAIRIFSWIFHKWHITTALHMLEKNFPFFEIIICSICSFCIVISTPNVLSFVIRSLRNCKKHFGLYNLDHFKVCLEFKAL